MTDADMKELIKTAKAAESAKGHRELLDADYAFSDAVRPAVVIELATRLRVLERAMREVFGYWYGGSANIESVIKLWTDGATAELEAEDNAD